jgi:DNA-binding PadR family transcriptional regulator
MREEHRRGRRDGDWGPPSPGGPEWGPRPGRGGRHGGPGFGGGPGWGPGGPGRHGGPGGPRWGRPEDVEGTFPFPPFGPGDPRERFGPGGGPWERFGPGFKRGGRGSRARKGDVRAAILDLFAEEEGRTWNGYQLIQEIPARTDGAWRPSPGSVYPALQQLVDEGLIAPLGEGRRRLFELTEAGRTYAQEHADQLRASWDAAAGMTDDDAIAFRDLMRQVVMAVMEVRRAGSADQVAQARAVLSQARKSLYLILAQDGEDAAADDAEDEPADTPDDGE